jgi:hypothetical protein
MRDLYCIMLIDIYFGLVIHHIKECILMKKRSFLISIIILINLIAIGLFFFRYVSSTAPIVGADFRYFIPRLLDNYLYQRLNGIFSVYWYTPSFAGGEPAYANPQDLQYSLPQALVWLFNPWQAIRLSMVFYIVAGFIAFYFFLRHLLGLGPLAGILGAVFSVATGFHIGHMVAGHVTFQLFPLFGVILIILFNPRLPHWLGGLLLSLLFTLFLYQGGFQVITFFILSLLITLPIIYLLKPSLLDGKHMLITLLVGAGLSILLCGSKLWAIYSLMQFSPRTASDQYNITWLQGLFRIVYQLLGAMTMIPARAIVDGISLKHAAAEFAIFLKNISGSPYSFAGLDMSLSPALFILLAGGALARIFQIPRNKISFDKKRLAAYMVLAVMVSFVIGFTLAKGSVYTFLHQLPILSSLRANVRYTSAFIFPLALVGAAVFDALTRKWRSKIGPLVVFILLNGLTLVSLSVYYQVLPEDQLRIFDIRQVMQVYPEIRYQNETFPVENVVPEANTWEVFELHATDLIDPFEPLFKSYSDRFQATLHAGPVDDVDNGYYNMINPTGYVYPEANNSKPYDRIPVTDKANLLAFINRRPTSWKLPLIQQVLNWVSLVALISEVGILLCWLVKKWVQFPKQKLV